MDTTGDGNHRLSPGETAKMIVTLANPGEDAESVTARLFKVDEDDETFEITDGIGSFGDIDSGEEAENTADTFEIRVASDAPSRYSFRFIA